MVNFCGLLCYKRTEKTGGSSSFIRHDTKNYQKAGYMPLFPAANQTSRVSKILYCLRNTFP